MTAKLLPASIGLATCALALGYALGGLLTKVPLLVTPGLLWLLGQRRGWGWTASVALVYFVGAAVTGLWLDLAAGWMLLSVMAALSAWDLDHFAQRLRGVGRVERERELEQAHLQRLLIVGGLGFLLAAVALGINVELGFCTASLLALLAILGLSRAIGFLRRESG